MSVIAFLVGLLATITAANDDLQSRSFVTRDDTEFVISRISSGRDTSQVALSDLKITENVVNLTIVSDGVNSLSSKFVQAMRRSGTSRAGGVTAGTTPLENVEGGSVFLAEVVVGGQDFSVVVDTGSSDPWLIVNNYKCYDVQGKPRNQKYCNFGPAYNPSSSTTYRQITDQNFNISYADGETLGGDMGYETFGMAGIQVPNQQFGLVDVAAWYGDGISSGLVGFAYRTLTSNYAGTDSTKDTKGSTLLYNPLFVNMYTNESVDPVFSLAIDRDPNVGGVLAIGGIPDIRISPMWITTPIHAMQVNQTDGTPVYEYYTIYISGYAISNSTSTQFNPYDTQNRLKVPLVANNTNTIVDSGTSLIYVPNNVASSVAEAFNPPATWDGSNMYYYVACNATAPVFGVGITQKVFYVNPEDMIVQIGSNTCVSVVQPNLSGLSILGSAWMKNVLAVFDIGSEQMRFAAREFYSSTASG
ncbi:aspartic-type endopeptidase [Lecanosticta acicola]|uniref:Aspartic-type endopeptidase n=1 Tax=Lecanosticta acicola TaxID=111012 RepID=A0AAI8Z2D1_9PEZI|nr:aspartic-type endopeptidase [Lecanosticta acicola]